MEQNKNICVIGAGKWGLNHVRTLAELNALGAVVDLNVEVLNFITKEFPKCNIYEKLNDAVIKKYDGFIVATNPVSHFKIAKKIIKGGKSLLVEKPLTLSYSSSTELCDLAVANNVSLMVGHVLLFHPAFLKMKNIINSGRIGDIQYIYSNRLNLGTFRSSENVFWSFAPHDIALFGYFFEEEPLNVFSDGVDILQKGIHDTSITTFKYSANKMGHIFVSWLHPFKEHRFIIIGSKGMLHFEDSFDNKNLLLYNKKVEFLSAVPTAKSGETIKIEFEDSKPLTNQLKYFLSCIDSGDVKISSGQNGADVIKILEKASNALNFN